MSKFTDRYRLLLGLDASWEVSYVSLSLEEKLVEIPPVHRGGAVTCTQRNATCGISDHGPERTWRHLDTMQFETGAASTNSSNQVQNVNCENGNRPLGRQTFAFYADV